MQWEQTVDTRKYLYIVDTGTTLNYLPPRKLLSCSLVSGLSGAHTDTPQPLPSPSLLLLSRALFFFGSMAATLRPATLALPLSRSLSAVSTSTLTPRISSTRTSRTWPRGTARLGLPAVARGPISSATYFYKTSLPCLMLGARRCASTAATARRRSRLGVKDLLC
jgi:hypothetical protein